jgi:hypothetical protein
VVLVSTSAGAMDCALDLPSTAALDDSQGKPLDAHNVDTPELKKINEKLGKQRLKGLWLELKRCVQDL